MKQKERFDEKPKQEHFDAHVNWWLTEKNI